MKKLLFIFVALNLVFFTTIENLFMSWSFSWTISKIAPYFLLFIIGFMLMKSIKSKFFKKIGIVQLAILLGIFIIPFSVGFILNPIYEGDFSKNGTLIKNEQGISDLKGFDFVVVTIPNCPYCHESVNSINIIQKRNPKLRIKYIVCSSEKREIEPYREKLNRAIKVDLAKDIDKLVVLSKSSFPCFIKVNRNDIYCWSNDEFGVRAKDLLESELK